MVFKLILSYVFIGSAIHTVPDADGWVSVERPQPRLEEFQDQEGVWVVFSKEIDGERFHVRLPDDPSCRYFSDELRIDASLHGDDLRLSVEQKGEEENQFDEKIQAIAALPEVLLIKAETSDDGKTLDLFYRRGERWVWERVHSTSKFLYTLKTESLEAASQNHHLFAPSLDIF